MQRIRKERRPTNRKSEVFLLFFPWCIFFYSLREVFSILPCIQFQHSPVVLCFFLSMEGNIPWMFMEIMWEFSICFFVSYKVNFPMYAGEFFLCYFFVPYKVNIPMDAGGFKQVQYKEYNCWMQVKIYISDQTSLRICNSVRINHLYLW